MTRKCSQLSCEKFQHVSGYRFAISVDTITQTQLCHQFFSIPIFHLYKFSGLDSFEISTAFPYDVIDSELYLGTVH